MSSNMYFPPSANCHMFQSALQPNPSSHRNHGLRKRVTLPPRMDLGSIEEERGASESEYDCALNLGAETPSASTTNIVDNNAFVAQWAQAGIAVPQVPARRPSWRGSSGKERSLKRELVDRDCGICPSFEYAVVPCRTLCCGKVFCTEHLADWLHGPNAQGRCPNCENICSLEGTTLSLATPTLLPASEVPRRRRLSASQQQPKPKPGVFPPSPLTAVQSHQNDTLHSHAPGSSSSSSSVTTSALESEEETRHVEHGLPLKLGIANPSTAALSTTPFSTSWGAVSRLMSIVTFMMLLYKLLS